MSEEQSSTTTEVSNSVLIIANRPKQFESAANFLSRRGWPCSVMANAKAAIKYVTENRPTWVFVSWNLKTASAKKLFTLLTRTFNANVVVFAEAGDSKTAAELTASGIPDVMQAPVSGPGIYMKIQRIIKQREEAQLAAANGAAAAAAGANDIIQGDPNAESASEVMAAKAEDLPAGGRWQLDGKDVKTGEDVWKFEADGDQSLKGKKGSFKFKGERPPAKKADGTWDTEGAGGSLHFEAKYEPASRGAAARSNAPKAEKLSDADLEALAAEMLEGNPGASATGTEEEDDGFGTVMKLGKQPKNREAIILGKDDDKIDGVSRISHDAKAKEETSITRVGKSNNENDQDAVGRLSADKQNDQDSGVIVQKGNKGKKFSVDTNSEDTTEHDVLETGAHPKSKTMSAVQKGPNANKYNQTQEGPDGESFSAIQKGPHANAHFEKQSHTPDIPGQDSEIQKGPTAKLHLLVPKKDPAQVAKRQSDKVTGKGAQTILAQSSYKALEESVISGDGALQSLDLINKGVAFTIRTQNFEGYMLAAAPEEPIDAEMVQRLKSKLIQHLEEAGEKVKFIEEHIVDIREVDFDGFVSDQAEFCAWSSHKANEIGLAFISQEKANPLAEKHLEYEMLAVDMGEVKTEDPLPFNLYIYLPVNNKHFLYCKKGKYITKTQKERMSGAQTNRFYIRPNELKEFKKYCAENKINARIVYHESRKAS